MEIQEDICHFCSLETRVITNEKSFVKIIKKVLSNEVLNYPEYSRVKSKLNTCLLCAHKLLQIEKTRVKIENATVNKHFNCFLCNEEQNLVQIQDWGDLNNLLDALDCKAKKKKFKLCLECFYFLKSIDEVKNNLFMHYPILKMNKSHFPVKQEYEIVEKSRISPSKTPQKISPSIKKKLTQTKAQNQLSPKIPLILLRKEDLTKLQEESKRQWNLVESESPQPNKIAKLTLRRTVKVPEASPPPIEEEVHRKSSRRRSLPAKISAEVESPRPGRRKSLEVVKKVEERRYRRVGRKPKVEVPAKKSIRIMMKIPQIVISDDEEEKKEEEVKTPVGRTKRKSAEITPKKTVVVSPKKTVVSPKKKVEVLPKKKIEVAPKVLPKKKGRTSNRKSNDKQLMIKLQQLQFNEDGSPVVKKRKSVTFNDDNLVQYFPSDNGDVNEKPKKARKKIVYPKEKIVSDVVIPDDEESEEIGQLDGEQGIGEKTTEEITVEEPKESREEETVVCDKEVEESKKRQREDSEDVEESAKRQCTDEVTLESVDNSVSEQNSEDPQLNEEPQTLNEEHQTLNEEPQSLNEEPQSLNNEPQSLNEEAQPLNEEPQSLNEEPQSLNEEPQSLSEEPQTLNEDPQSTNENIEPTNETEDPKPPNEEQTETSEPEKSEDSQPTNEEPEETAPTIDVDQGLNEIVDHIAKECIAPSSKIVILHQNIFNAVEEKKPDTDLKNTNGKTDDQTIENGLKIPFTANQ